MTDLLAVISACSAFAFTPVLAQEPNLDWTIVPGQRVGAITATTSESALEAFFGLENMKRVDVHIGEGFTEPGNAVYPGDATRRIEIVWLDETRSTPKEIRITGESSIWRTQEGISLGSTLKQIERLNRRPFRLAGFAWDYEGTILDCGGGRLTILGCFDLGDRTRRTHQRSMVVRLAPDRKAIAQPEYRQVLGDGEFSSGHPAMQALNPRVYQMIVFLRQ